MALLKFRLRMFYLHSLIPVLMFAVIFMPLMPGFAAGKNNSGKGRAAAAAAKMPDMAKIRERCESIVSGGPQNVKALFAGLSSPDTAVKTEAHIVFRQLVSHVAEQDNDKARQMVLDCMTETLSGSNDENIQDLMLEQMRFIAGKQEISVVSKYLANERFASRAAKLIVTVGGAQAEKALADALPGANDKCAVSIIMALGDLGSVLCIKEYEKLYSKADPSRRDVILYAISRSGSDESGRLLKEWVKNPPEGSGLKDMISAYEAYAERLLELGKDKQAKAVAMAVIQAASAVEQSVGIRCGALTLLGSVGDKDAVRQIVEALDDADHTLRNHAVVLLGGLEGSDVTKTIAASAKDARGRKLASLINVLSLRKDFNDISILKANMKSEDPILRQAVQTGLGNLRSAESAGILFEMYETAGKPERQSISDMLNRFSGEDFLKEAGKALSAQSPDTKKLAISILMKKAAKQYTGAMMDCLASSDSAVAGLAARAVGNLADDAQISQLLKKAVGSGDGPYRESVLNSVAIAAPRLADKQKLSSQLADAYAPASPDVKCWILSVFPVLGGKRGLDIAVSSLAAPEPGISDKAMRAIVEWREPDALPALLKLAETGNDTARVLALRGMVRLLQTADIPVDEKIGFYKAAFKTKPGLAEVRLLLAGVVCIDDEKIIDLVLPLVGVPEVNAEATLAITKMGFEQVFNRKDLAGWKGLLAAPYDNPDKRSALTAEALADAQKKADEDMRAHWRAENGEIVFDGKGRSLCTVKDYSDFEMLVDWKILPNGDSGIYLRGSPQVQIWDHTKNPVGSGGIYNNQKNPSKPLVCADNPIGDWNTFRIKMTGDKVTVYLNGKLVTDNVVMENYWDRTKPIFPSGQIELQNHGNTLYFRNIFIKGITAVK